MTYTHLSDEELIQHVWANVPADPLAGELALRLAMTIDASQTHAELIERIEEARDILQKLQDAQRSARGALAALAAGIRELAPHEEDDEWL